MRPRSVFDLRQIRLADAFALLPSPSSSASVAVADLLTNRTNELELRHRPAQAAQRSFDLAQVTDFLAELHVIIAPCASGQSLFQYEIFILQFAINVNKEIRLAINHLQAGTAKVMAGGVRVSLIKVL
jgi:hypothetical protein